MEDDLFNIKLEPISLNTGLGTSTSSSGTSTKGSFFGGLDFGSVLSSGVSLYGSIAGAKAQKDLANKQLELQKLANEGTITQGQMALEMKKMELEALKLQDEPKNNTLLYAGLGVGGFLLLGGVIYLAVKK